MTSDAGFGTGSDGQKCHACGRTHQDWNNIGEKYTINSKHHSGWGQTIECGHCGSRDEVTGR